MSGSNGSSNPKPLPKKLEEDLSNVSNRVYRQNSHGRISTSVDAENIIPTLGSKKPPSSIAHLFDDSAEKAMYDEILGPMLKPKKFPVGSGYEATRLAASTRNHNNLQSSSSSSSSSTVSSSNDFTTTILQRLKIVEGEAKESRHQLATQITRNQQLEEEVIALKAVTSDSKQMISDMQKLKNENIKLKKQIQEMEEFLADYGLEWVGNDFNQQQQTRGQGELQKKKQSSNNKGYKDDHDDDNEGEEEEEEEEGHIVSFAEFARYIKELNDIIFAEPTQIVKDERARKARLAHASELLERIRVIYYKNGLVIKRGPFRPCHSDSYLSFVQDVVDGYFPSEFRNEYPDGVTFDLIDKHDVDYVEGVTNQSQDLRMSTSQFLSRLSKKTVLKNGEIVEIRGDIEARLHLEKDDTGSNNNNNGNSDNGAVGSVGSTNSVYFKGEARKLTDPDRSDNNADVERPKTGQKSTSNADSTNANKNIVIETEASKNPNQIKLGNIAKIQVKWIDGTTLVMSMFELNTVQELREEIGAHFNANKSKNDRLIRTSCQDVEFRTAFPSKLLLDSMTLMEASLVPNGTIHARKI